MRLQTDILSESLEKIGQQADVVVQRMFERLFRIDPKLESHFDSVAMPELRSKILQTLFVVIRYGNQPIPLTRFLQNLGEYHARLQLSIRNYEAFSQAWLQSLEEALPEEWTSEYQNAWVDAIEVIVSLMQTSSRIQRPFALHSLPQNQSVVREYSMTSLFNASIAESPIYDETSSGNSFDPTSCETSSENKIIHENSTVDFEVLLHQLPLNVIVVNREFQVLFENELSQRVWANLQNRFNAAESLQGQSPYEVLFPNRSRQIDSFPHCCCVQIGSLTLSLQIAERIDAQGNPLGWICIWDLVN